MSGNSLMNGWRRRVCKGRSLLIRPLLILAGLALTGGTSCYGVVPPNNDGVPAQTSETYVDEGVDSQAPLAKPADAQ